MAETSSQPAPDRRRKPSLPLLAAALLMALVLAVAAALRLADLDNRTMHCDEAVHAVKFGELLERGRYVYDPREYHGPTLNYLTWPVARMASARRLTDLSQIELRLVPAVFGILAVALVWLLRHELGCAATLCAALFTAISPAMVFYSRYYIQEMLLVGFTFGAIVALWRYAASIAAESSEDAPTVRWFAFRKILWLLLLGACVGMMHATKETCVIALFAIAVAAVPVARFGLPAGAKCGSRRRNMGRWVFSGGIVILTAGTVSALFFSSFLHRPSGVVDSLTAYLHYFGRASGAGSAGGHVHASDYYFRILFWWHPQGGSVWSEAPIAVLAAVAVVVAFSGKGVEPRRLPWIRFLAIYTLIMIDVYAFLPYKTPWCALGMLHGMILLAGVGAAALVRLAPTGVLRIAAATLLVGGAAWLGWQAWRASFVAFEDPNNPYVYAHSTADVRLLGERIQRIAAVHPDREKMHVQVICPDHDYWPLPWYLRAFGRVGWFGQVPGGPVAPIVITQPKMRQAVLDYAYRKQPPGQRHLMQIIRKPDGGDWRLRPQVPLEVYIRYDLWQRYEQRNHRTHGRGLSRCSRRPCGAKTGLSPQRPPVSRCTKIARDLRWLCSIGRRWRILWLQEKHDEQTLPCCDVTGTAVRARSGRRRRAGVHEASAQRPVLLRRRVPCRLRSRRPPGRRVRAVLVSRAGLQSAA